MASSQSRFCPGFVDTDMSDFIKDSIPADEMLRTSDISEALRFLLRVSPACVIPEIVFQRPGRVHLTTTRGGGRACHSANAGMSRA